MKIGKITVIEDPTESYAVIGIDEIDPENPEYRIYEDVFEGEYITYKKRRFFTEDEYYLMI